MIIGEHVGLQRVAGTDLMQNFCTCLALNAGSLHFLFRGGGRVQREARGPTDPMPTSPPLIPVPLSKVRTPRPKQTRKPALGKSNRSSRHIDHKIG